MIPGLTNIVSKLREQRIPYKLAGGGEAVLVPVEKVYELRLAMANDGLPSGGHVGFEIFDHSDFSTTEFVLEPVCAATHVITWNLP